MAHYPVSLWFRAVRAYSFTASITPVLLGASLAFYQTGRLDIPLLIAALVGGVSLHIGTNLVNDYFDYQKGVDREGAYGGSGVLVERRMKPRDVLRGAFVAFAVATPIGLWLTWQRGWPIVAFGLTGLLGGYFYTAGPIAYKYRAAGEILVFTLMGPLMVWGAHFVQVGRIEWLPLLVSLPVGLLVAAILFANNIRDADEDTSSGYHTQASLLGGKLARTVFGAMLASAYLVLAALVYFDSAPAFALLALLTIPWAVRLQQMIRQSVAGQHQALLVVVQRTAQLHLQFGLLLIAGFVLAHFFK